VLAGAGIRLAATTCWGTSDGPDDLLRLRRIVLDEKDTKPAILSKIDGGGDWREIKERAAYRVRLLTGRVPRH
jgi:hypothetical protein